jgi:hypothetical protein
MYDIRDILRKAIEIASKKRAVYQKLQDNSGDVRMRVLIGVFIKAMNLDISYYQRLIDNVSDQMAIGLDFSTFDKISSLVNQFSRLILDINITDRKELVSYVLEQEKASYALMIDIQGRLVVTETSNSIAYYVFSELILNKKNYIEELEAMR